VQKLFVDMLLWCAVFRPFRKYDLKQGGKSWDSVNRLDKGCIYQEVCIVKFSLVHLLQMHSILIFFLLFFDTVV